MYHSFPLSSKEALEARGTHQPLTHNYLKERGKSSGPQIIVKTADSQRAADEADRHTYYAKQLPPPSLIINCLTMQVYLQVHCMSVKCEHHGII